MAFLGNSNVAIPFPVRAISLQQRFRYPSSPSRSQLIRQFLGHHLTFRLAHRLQQIQPDDARRVSLSIAFHNFLSFLELSHQYEQAAAQMPVGTDDSEIELEIHNAQWEASSWYILLDEILDMPQELDPNALD